MSGWLLEGRERGSGGGQQLVVREVQVFVQLLEGVEG